MIDERGHLAHQLHTWAERGILPQSTWARALELAGIVPSPLVWRRTLDLFLLIIGTLFVVAGLLFFFAYNWDDLGRLSRLLSGEIALVIALGVVWWRGLDHLVGQAALWAAAALLGGMLAIYGQVYQTGAHAWQLFATWAVLLLPWAWLGRFSALWVLWLAIVNIALGAWWSILPISNRFDLYCLSLAALHGFALLIWEWQTRKTAPTPMTRWAPWLIATVFAGYLTLPAIQHISTSYIRLPLPHLAVALPYLAGISLLGWLYTQRIRDLFMLAVGGASLIIVITCGAWRILDPDSGHHTIGAIIWMILALLLIGQSSALAMYLRHLAQKWEVAA